ncbi:MAG: tRNA (N(6)-L-threonylcarbamoyladenosine(37)-C(2))-methylthiotransferase MtaB [Bacteroidetes bacterium RIFCSPLOWO2_12_FULL_31_6]|nr:MAG: tRNA (N(6)-L-threonylcarbamoyladenosine(37)-C(2))-methylthiotransferase MtaB [Bacteroidetes bacterium RIFCSPLOWO2_12_FULL_31_6]
MHNIAKKVAFYTLGCKLNFSESSTIARVFLNNGFVKVDFEETADVYVINTCSVTDNADKKCRSIVRQALKQSPEAYIAIMGCYAQLKPQEIAKIPGVDVVLGASEKFNLFSIIDEKLEKRTKTLVNSCDINHVNTFFPSYSSGDRTRVFLKVQDGCDYKCSFCTIPLARGKSRSETIKNTLKIANEAAKTGVKEIVLTGVNIGDFGKTSPHPSPKEREQDETFLDLINELDKIEGVKRFRISSIEPNLLTNEIIEFVAKSNKFVPHFHIPLQSCSPEILKLMKRRYKLEIYTERVNKIKSLIPDCCIGVDVIVGFPGETDEHFLETYQYLNELDISYLHVFTYSERENTVAFEMEGVVPQEIRKERSKMLHVLSEKKRRCFYEQQLGKTNTVLWEAEHKENFMFGFTENYVKVKTKYDVQLVNQLKEVKLLEIENDVVILTYNI